MSRTCPVCGKIIAGELCQKMWYDFMAEQWMHGDREWVGPEYSSMWSEVQ